MQQTTVVQVPVKMGPMNVNSYVLFGDSVVLVDTGVSGQAERILSAVADAGRSFTEVTLILLTHGHGDHAGSAEALQVATGAPIALGAADLDTCRAGRDDEMYARGFFSKQLLKAIKRQQDRAAQADAPTLPQGPTPDILISEELSLAEYGVDAVVVPTPGHSRGSLSVFTASGDAFVGDLIGGGGRSRTLPKRGIFVCDEDAMSASIAEIIRRAPERVHTGHDASPFTLEQLKAAFPELS